jgi:hypothetical protein
MSGYTDILARLRAGLIDANGLIWDNNELDEALRQALADMALAAGADYTLDGLDGALTTSLPIQHFATLVRGAAAYALLWRAAERVDAFNVRPDLPAEVLSAAAALLARFESAVTHLAALRTAGLQTSAVTPYPDGTESAQPGWQLPDALDAAGG